MKEKFIFSVCIIASIVSLYSCKKDDAVTCTTCSSPETTNSFEVCREGDGNASVSGQNTGTPYDVYMEGLRESGAQCDD